MFIYCVITFFSNDHYYSNNMLYPKEDRVNKQLILACHSCEHSEPARDPCVYRNEIKHSVQYVFYIIQC